MDHDQGVDVTLPCYNDDVLEHCQYVWQENERAQLTLVVVEIVVAGGGGRAWW